MSAASPEVPHGRTLRVAAASKARRTSAEDREIIKAAELIELRPASGKHLSLAAKKVLNLMIQAAAGDAWREGHHRISKKELKGSHESNDRLGEVLDELTSTRLEIRHKMDGQPGILRVPLMSESFVPDDDAAHVRFQFHDKVRLLMSASDSYAALHTKTVLAFKSRYALSLYEIGAQLAGRESPIMKYEVEDLRKVLGVPAKTMPRWQDFRRYVLETAVAEINQLATFQMTYSVAKRGRAIALIEISAWRKAATDVLAASQETERHSAGRKARREGKVEKVEPVKALPVSTRSSGIPGVPPEDLDRLMKSAKKPLDIIARAIEAEKQTPGRGREIVQAALTD